MFSVILARPENHENIGLVARAMKNTGFNELRLAGIDGPDAAAFRTAVHAEEILKKAAVYADLQEAVADLQVVFAATAKPRKNFEVLAVQDAVWKMSEFPGSARIGLVFGNERTGLTSGELQQANFLFTIPQALRQPSYNLAAAVLITLFLIFCGSRPRTAEPAKKPLMRRDQESLIRVLLQKLELKGFIHKTNREHVTEIMFDLFGRLLLTERDRRFLLALFAKGVQDF